MRSRYLSAIALLSIAAAACSSKDSGPSYASSADSATIATLADGAYNLASNTLQEAFGSQGTTLDGFLNFSKAAGTESATDRARALALRVIHEVSLHGTSLNTAALAPGLV
ncbi:MAG TPA: hypothetical protein VFI13_06640, partial [Gemmatimonadales bacterium]|nr:hypothetical protein [Gemmatimonadales bacterium]